MKSLIKQFFILLFCSLLFITCKKDKPYQPVQLCSEISNNADSIHKYIKGEWNWVEGRRMNRQGEMEYITPKTQGYKETVKITSDTLIASRSGQPDLVGTYAIGKESDITNMPEDSASVLIVTQLPSTNQFYYQVFICKEYMMFYLSYRGDVSYDVIYKKTK
jgi:hypothetical protein